MDEFVAFSKSSQETLKMAMLSASLPVNIVILGEKAVGKNHLASMIAPNAKVFEAVELEEMFLSSSIDFQQLSEVIIHNLHKVQSTKNLIERFDKHNIKVIATSIETKPVYEEIFQVKIDVPPLTQREDDVDFLVQKYVSEAKRLFLIEKEPENIEIDLSNNAISLKKSIYSSLLFNSLKRESVMNLLENFLYKEFDKETRYKELLPIFEIPLLKAGKRAFKSQLQMAKKFDINRNTLRKKISENGLDE